MTDNIKLLPLPEGEASSFGSYNVHDDEAMIEYARANVALNTALLRAEIEALLESLADLKAENEMLRKVLKEAADALEAAREKGWQPIETAPKPDIGADGFGERLLFVVDCGDGSTPSVRRGYWEGTDWYLDCCMGLATAYGYRVTHWRPLPALPTIDAAMRKESNND